MSVIRDLNEQSTISLIPVKTGVRIIPVFNYQYNDKPVFWTVFFMSGARLYESLLSHVSPSVTLFL